MIIYVVGQVLNRFIIDSVIEQRKLIGEIADRLIFDAHVYSNPGTVTGELAEETSRALRQSSSQLQARTHAIPCYRALAALGIVRSRKDVDAASSDLIGLSNSVYRGDPLDNYERRRLIAVALGLRAPE